MIAAMIAPTWITAVNPVTDVSSTLRSSSFSVIVRCPVEETGRNSVTASTTPRIAAFQMSTDSVPHAGAVERLGDLAQRPHAGLDVGHVQRGVPADQLRAGGHVVADHDRYRRDDVEAVEPQAGPFPAGGDRGELLAGELGREEHREPPVGQLPGQLQVLRPDRGEVGRN